MGDWIVSLGRKGSTGSPSLTILICAACAIVFAFHQGDREQAALAYHAHTFDMPGMFTSTFAHADIWHLLGNLFFFYCFARIIETQISITGYLVAFVLFVFVTNIAFSLAANGPTSTVGLSGVVFGFMGIFLMRYPQDRIECAVWFVVLIMIVDVAAEYRHVEHPNVNYIAHIAGFGAGVVFRLLLWRVFTTEKPQPRKRMSYVAPTGRPARRY
jgi:membrane associated rhomboid family serine protease